MLPAGPPMSSDELFREIGNGYLSLIHLNDDLGDVVATLTRLADTWPRERVGELLRDGDSWRERLPALVMASRQGLARHYDSLLHALHNSGGISLVPLAAAIAVAVRDFGCPYDPNLTRSLDRNAWDGEIGFALDWLHYTIGMGDVPERALGPNYGQEFAAHLKFYTELAAT